MLNKKLLFLFLLLLPLISAVDVNDTLYINAVTNYSIYINETVTFDKVNVSDDGRIKFHNLDTTLTIGKFYNTNDTYDSVIDIFNLTNALIYYDNGTVLQQEFTGDINISVLVSNNLTIMNNYTVNDTAPPSGGDPINQGGSPGDTKINNTLLEPLLIQIENLDNSFIYMSNGTIMQYLTGDLNITLSDDEYFYIITYEELLKLNENQGTIAYDVSGNANNGTINGSTYDNDGILLTLVEDTDYLLSTDVFTLINTRLSWDQIIARDDYTLRGSAKQSILDTTTGLGSFADFWEIIVLAIVITVVIGLLLITFGGTNKR